MKNEKKISMTSKERKEQRLTDSNADRFVACESCGHRTAVPAGKTVKCSSCGASVSNIPESGDGGVTPGVVETTGGRLALSRKNVYIILTALVMAAILITLAILIPTVFLRDAMYAHINNPVAIIHLSNGDKIELEIFEKETPNVATNFIYLAKKGYFDGVVIFDNTNKYVRFGQYMDTDFTKFRSTDEAFLKKITDITIPSSNLATAKTALNYRVSKDSSIEKDPQGLVNKGQEQWYISSLGTRSSIDFQICTMTSAQLT